MEAKSCSKCKELKGLCEFNKNSRAKDGKDSQCRDCKSKYYHLNSDKFRQYAKNQRGSRTLEQSREIYFRHKYNLTQQAYLGLFLQQGYRCAICSKDILPGKHAHVDHDHGCCPGYKSCGKCIRGILCMSCNHLLGKAGDSIQVLLSAVEYLAKYRTLERSMGTEKDNEKTGGENGDV